MRKFVMVSLVLALLGAFVLPVLLTPGTADAWGWSTSKPQISCDPGPLQFTAIKGVNPASQAINVWNSGSGTLWWSVRDSASWLSLGPSSGYSKGEKDGVKLTVNSKNLAVGQYTATITVSASGATNSPQTVTVNLNVIEPIKMGPIMIGMEGIWPWSPDYVYDGTAANLLLTPGGFTDLSGAAVEIKDCWHMSLDVDLAAGLITGGTLRGNGDLPSGQIIGGQLQPLSALLPGFDLGDNYLIILMIDAGDQGILGYAGMLLTDIGGLLDAIPNLMNMLGSSSASSAGIEAMNQGIVIPLGPIMDILPKLLPIMEDLLPKLLPLIKPLASLIPPVVVIMPADVMMELMSLLMP